MFKDIDIARVIWFFVATLGGIAKVLNEYLINKKPVVWGRLVAQAFVSGFSGWIFAEVISLSNPDWVIVTAGVGGFMGAEAMKFLVSIVEKRASA